MYSRKLSVFLACLLLGIFLAASLSLAGKATNPDNLTYPLYQGKKLGLAITGNPAALHKVFISFTGTPGASEEGLVKGLGGRIKHTYWLVPAISATIPEAAIDKLMKNPLVAQIEEDIKVYAIAQTVPWGISRVNAPAVHASGNLGTGVKVAVIDSGIDYNHPDLRDNYCEGYDFVNKDEDPMDDNSHGTHVAGTIAASDNAEGVVGVAPEADLYALKVLDASGSGDYSDVIAAVQWCVENDIQVTNNSYGSTEYPGDTVKRAFDDAYYAYGILHVAAAGNSGNFRGTGDNVIYPALWDSLIAVAATDSKDKRAYFSSTGPAVELAAPGASIYSTLPGGGYGTKSGTSMASPHVAGVAALVIWEGVNLSASEVRNILTLTAVDLGISGRDNLYGYGRVDAASAVAAVPQSSGTIIGIVYDNDTSTGIESAMVAAGDKSTITGLDGSYSLTIPPGSYTVAASAEGYESSSENAIVVFENVTTTLNFSLTAVTITYGSIQGRVTDSENYAISGATVTDGTRTSTTDEQGFYQLLEVPAETYNVTASAAGYVSSSQSVSVTSGVTSQADFELSPATVATEVKAADILWNTEGGKGGTAHLLITVVVKDNLDNLVSGAVVYLSLAGPTSQSSSGTTGSNGTVTFKYPNAPSGTYTATVTDIKASGLDFAGPYAETWIKP